MCGHNRTFSEKSKHCKLATVTIVIIWLNNDGRAGTNCGNGVVSAVYSDHITNRIGNSGSETQNTYSPLSACETADSARYFVWLRFRWFTVQLKLLHTSGFRYLHSIFIKGVLVCYNRRSIDLWPFHNEISWFCLLLSVYYIAILVLYYSGFFYPKFLLPI